MDYTATTHASDAFARDFPGALAERRSRSRGGGRTQDVFGATLCRLPGRYADVRRRRGRSLLDSWVPTTRNTPGRSSSGLRLTRKPPSA